MLIGNLRDRRIGALEIPSDLTVRGRVKRRLEDRDRDVASAQLIDERTDHERPWRGRRWLSKTPEQATELGSQSRGAVRGTRCHVVAKQRLVIALTRRERAQPLLEQQPLAIGRPDTSKSVIDP